MFRKIVSKIRGQSSGFNGTTLGIIALKAVATAEPTQAVSQGGDL